MIVSRPVGPGHQTQILCKEQPVFLALNHLCSLLPIILMTADSPEIHVEAANGAFQSVLVFGLSHTSLLNQHQ